ncbi:MAG: gluconeogenesis factor YvcK family protein [Candidatus Sungbacteria bacterium]|nr:YvcK family protein [bacterium]MDZ4260590.1 gluconeogenesis factor YvcK family protein [Candidatus Sungbacteria bacterium]
MAKKTKRILVIGGGTGTSVLLSGLKRYPVSLSAIITTGDDGSSSGVLRKEFNMIPPGDIRQCLIALARGNFSYLNDRFHKGFLHGHTLGNLLITLFCQKNENFQEAIDEVLKLVGAEGSLIPMTLKPVTLVAQMADGRKLKGESVITPSKEISSKLKKLTLFPSTVHANPRAIKALGEADVIVVGPGNLYSSVLPNFLVSEIREAFVKSGAKKVYVSNLFTQPGHTDNFSVPDFLRVLQKYIGTDAFTHVVYNTASMPQSLIASCASEIIESLVSIPKDMKKDKRFIGRSLVGTKIKPHDTSDPIAKIRNPFLHDSAKLARVIMEIA